MMKKVNSEGYPKGFFLCTMTAPTIPKLVHLGHDFIYDWESNEQTCQAM